ncbi:MAG: biotin synthase BioB [Tissierellia bacterium]|nr:biotin synthase BioB [Tissierellia bacterium]
MENFVQQMKEKVLSGGSVTREEALELFHSDFEELTAAAHEIREHFHGNAFDLCSIIDAKGGNCSEDCKFCAQSGHHDAQTNCHPLVDVDTVIEGARRIKEQGILRYSLVTVGRRLSRAEVDQVCEIVKRVKEEVDLELCVSNGLLDYEDFVKLREAGVTRIHNNLETSEGFFPEIVSTHTFQDKVDTIVAAQRAGLEICSGGIIGLGESIEDRIDMAFSLKELGVKSVNLNVLNPIEGTPLGDQIPLGMEEINRTFAVYRFILGYVFLRLAGGRALMEEGGISAFQSGANATITGDLLTTAGITAQKDRNTIESMGYEAKVVALGE